MPPQSIDTEIKASSDAAEAFVSRYYDALSKNAPLLPFYVNSTSRYSIKADISINGAQLETPADYYNLVKDQGNGVTYTAECFDSHVVNPSFEYNAPENIPDNQKHEKQGDKMSIVVMVTGRVKYGRDRDAPSKMFTETFVLVPNWETMQRNPPRGIRKWLIMSQNFRAL